MSISPGRVLYTLSFRLSPIILTGGIASAMPGGILPIVALTQAVDFVFGLLQGAEDINLDQFFANFSPLPGATLIDNDIGEYPFANQAVAANAIIRNPLVISLLMISPAQGEGGFGIKLATMIALQATLAQHNALGGTYTIATPSFFYPNCVMLRMTDASSGADMGQPQNTWRLDFRQPLLTLQDAQQAQNNLMSQISAGTQVMGLNGGVSWSGLSPTVGNPTSIASPSIIPSSAPSSGTGVASPTAGAISP